MTKKTEKHIAPPPSAIRVGYQHVTVRAMGLGEAYGRYNQKEAYIHYSTEQPQRELVNTIIHEVLHAVFYTSSLSQHPVFDKEEDEELVAAATANALTQVFLDNPRLLDWIKDNLHT